MADNYFESEIIVGTGQTEQDLLLQDPSGEWPAKLEAHGGAHLRLRLLATTGRSLPRWEAGAALDLACRTESGPQICPCSVLRQQGDVVWVLAPPIWRSPERRGSMRAVAGFPVTLRTQGRSETAPCLDIAPGGLRIRLNRSLAVASRARITIAPPSDSDPMEIEAVVLHVEQGVHAGEFEVGLKFVRMPTAIGLRLERLCAASGDRPLPR